MDNLVIGVVGFLLGFLPLGGVMVRVGRYVQRLEALELTTKDLSEDVRMLINCIDDKVYKAIVRYGAESLQVFKRAALADKEAI